MNKKITTNQRLVNFKLDNSCVVRHDLFLVVYLSLLTGFAFAFPFPVFGNSVHISYRKRENQREK